MSDRPLHIRFIARPADTDRSGGMIGRKRMQAFKRLVENPLGMLA